MDEFTVGIIALVVFFSSLFGFCFADSYHTDEIKLKCVQAIHDKPALEINLVCGKK